MTDTSEYNKFMPARPNSQWASGTRRELKNPPREPAGFRNGARVVPRSNP